MNIYYAVRLDKACVVIFRRAKEKGTRDNISIILAWEKQE